MKRDRCLFLFLTLGLLSFWSTSLGSASQPEAEPQDEPQAEEGDGQQDQPSADAARRRRGPAVYTQVASRRLLVSLNKLRSQMIDQLDLSEEQEETLGAMFDKFLVDVEKHAARGAGGDGNKDESGDSIRKLRMEMIEAQKAGDDDRAKELRTQIQAAMSKQRPMTSEAVSKFLDTVAEELDEEQEPQFRTLVKRLKLDVSSDAQRDSLGRLMRAVMDPELGMTAEQHQAVREIIRDAFASQDRGERSPEKTDQLASKVKSDIMEELTPEQRVKLEAKLKAEESKPDRRFEKRRGRPANPAEDEESADEEGEEEEEQP